MTTEATAIKNVHRQALKVTPTLKEAKAVTVFAIKLPGAQGGERVTGTQTQLSGVISRHPWDHADSRKTCRLTLYLIH